MCNVTVENRGRCQKCRYTACLTAGMVADLVMSDKERLSRIRLVDQNRERRRGPLDTPTGQDVDIFTNLATVAANLYGAEKAADTSVEWLRCRDFMAGAYRGLGAEEPGVSASYHELLYVRLAFIMPPGDLQAFPTLQKLSIHIRQLGLTWEDVTVILLLVGTRPRLSWPQDRSAQLAAVWETVSGAVRRRSASQDNKEGLFIHIHSLPFNLLSMLSIFPFITCAYISTDQK